MARSKKKQMEDPNLEHGNREEEHREEENWGQIGQYERGVDEGIIGVMGDPPEEVS